MKPLSDRQAARCETSRTKRCRCRCRGTAHGISRAREDERLREGIRDFLHMDPATVMAELEADGQERLL